MLSIAYSKDAIKALRRIPGPVAKTIRAKIERYAAEPASVANLVKTLKGVDGMRLRVGDWRVIFTVEGGQMNVIRIRPRGSAYDD